MKHLFIFLCMSFGFIQCTQDDTIETKQEVAAIAAVGNGSNDNNSGEIFDTNNLVQLLDGGYACSDPPIPGTWYIKQSLLQHYQHFYQINASPTYPGSRLCGPTSYMLAAHMIATKNNRTYPSSKAQLGVIYNRLHNAGRFDNQLGMYISDLLWYRNQYDHSFFLTTYMRTTDRTSMKSYIEYHIKSGYPVIATIQIFGNKRSTWYLNDSDLYDQSGKTYYVSKNGNIGHFVLIIGIKINADGTGTIWYKDPLSPNGETQSASYTRFLDAMKFNGNASYYDAVAVFEGYFENHGLLHN